MLNNLKRVFFVTLLFTIYCPAYGQILDKVDTVTINYKITDSVVLSLVGFSDVSIICYNRKNEIFTDEDTLKRDYIISGSSKWTIDKLQGLLQCDYTGAYDLIECRKQSKKTTQYLILCFVDSFIMGTNQNVFYVILKSENNSWKHYNSYENQVDKPLEDIKVTSTKKGLRLKGKYLKQIKRRSLDCLD